jgi:hypothetical protein
MSKKNQLPLAKSLIICVLGFTSLSACSKANVTEPIQITTAPISYSKPIVPRVDELALSKVEWVVITEANYASVLARLRDEAQEPILYAVTSQGYANIVNNQVDVLKLIRQQKQIIAVYESWQY